MTSEAEKELKPCPFCGGDASPSGFGQRFGVSCKNEKCFAAPYVGIKNISAEDIAVKHWNTRTADDKYSRLERLINHHFEEMGYSEGHCTFGQSFRAIQKDMEANTVIIEGISQIIDCQKQTADALIKKVRERDKAIRMLREALVNCEWNWLDGDMPKEIIEMREKALSETAKFEGALL